MSELAGYLRRTMLPVGAAGLALFGAGCSSTFSGDKAEKGLSGQTVPSLSEMQKQPEQKDPQIGADGSTYIEDVFVFIDENGRSQMHCGTKDGVEIGETTWMTDDNKPGKSCIIRIQSQGDLQSSDQVAQELLQPTQ